MIKFKIFIILLFCGLNLTFSFAQQINESIKYIHVNREGLKDKSEFVITSNKMEYVLKNNVTGIIFYEYINKEKDTIISYLSNATLLFQNKKNTLQYYVEDTFNLTIPVGKYKFSIQRPGVGFINKKIRIKDNTKYTFYIKLKPRRLIFDITYECKTKEDVKKLKKLLKSSSTDIEKKCKCKETLSIIYD